MGTNRSLYITLGVFAFLFILFKLTLDRPIKQAEALLGVEEAIIEMDSWNEPEADKYMKQFMEQYGIVDNFTIKRISFVEEFPPVLDLYDYGYNDVVGYAFGMNEDNVVDVYVDYSFWKESSSIARRLLIFHELGHDILNLEHSNDPNDFMFPLVDADRTTAYLEEKAKEVFSDIENNDAFIKAEEFARNNSNEGCGFTYYEVNGKDGGDLNLRGFYIGRFLGYLLSRDYGISVFTDKAKTIEALEKIFPLIYVRLSENIFTAEYAREAEEKGICSEEMYLSFPEEVAYVSALIDNHLWNTY